MFVPGSKHQILELQSEKKLQTLFYKFQFFSSIRLQTLVKIKDFKGLLNETESIFFVIGLVASKFILFVSFVLLPVSSSILNWGKRVAPKKTSGNPPKKKRLITPTRPLFPPASAAHIQI